MSSRVKELVYQQTLSEFDVDEINNIKWYKWISQNSKTYNMMRRLRTFRNLGLGNIATRNLLCCNRKFHIVKGSYLQKNNMDKRTHAWLILTTVYSVQGVYHESKGQLKSYIALMG